MSPGNAQPEKTWQEIAAEASQEKDSTKLLHLTAELARALAEQFEKVRPSHKV
jgi:hypothetical protein